MLHLAAGDHFFIRTAKEQILGYLGAQISSYAAALASF